MPATDVIAVKQPDGSIKCSPFVISFKNKAKETSKVIILIDGKEAPFSMTIDKGTYIPYFTKTTREKIAEKKGFLMDWIDSNTPQYYTLKPKDEDLKKLKITKEVNSLIYVSEYESVKCRLFFWNYKNKIIVSDVDGTITKSDVMGQFYNRLGKDYSHEHVAPLFTALHLRGYKFLYLTARNLSAFDMTLKYIEDVEQENVKMPIAPVITTANRMIHALVREVVIRKPESFKIPILNEIRDLFPKEETPIFAGFGNRPTDDISYISIGVPSTNCYRINKKGIVTVEATKKNYNGYISILKEVDSLFPKLEILNTNEGIAPLLQFKENLESNSHSTMTEELKHIKDENKMVEEHL